MSGWGAIYNNTRLMLHQQSETLARLQAQVASGVRVQTASDDPTDAFRILGLRADQRQLETYLENVETASGSMQVAGDLMQKISDINVRVRQLMTQVTSGTYSAANREQVAGEIDSLLEQAFSIANTKHQGRYLFGGSSIKQPAFTATREEGTITGVTYTGSHQPVDVPVAPGVTYEAVLVGDAVFQRNRRADPAFLGPTGAAVGHGTASVRGDVYLTVAHDSTTYLGASGVATGTDTALDTIVGNDHTLTIDEAAGTVSLDGGPQVSFGGVETNLRVTNGDGEVVYLDVTGLAAGFSGTVDIETTATLSVDDGASTVTADYTDDNLAVTDAATGRVLYVDTTGIASAGTEPIRVEGTYDLFGALINVRDLLMNERGLAQQDQLDLLSESVAGVDEINRQTLQAQTTIGSKIGAMESLRDSLENMKAYTNDETAALEDADVVQVATDIARQQTLYQMTLATASRLLQMSLLDFIR